MMEQPLTTGDTGGTVGLATVHTDSTEELLIAERAEKDHRDRGEETHPSEAGKL